jgi:hypothetical protein
MPARKTPEEKRTRRIWYEMKRRCTIREHRTWFYYGGRGIKVCKRWLDPVNGYANFVADMGLCPIGYSIERRKVNGHYTPGNCIWIPRREQAFNRGPYQVPGNGWQAATLDDLFPVIADERDTFIIPKAMRLRGEATYDYLWSQWSAQESHEPMTIRIDLERAAEALARMQCTAQLVEWERQPLGFKERCRREAKAAIEGGSPEPVEFLSIAA